MFEREAVQGVLENKTKAFSHKYPLILNYLKSFAPSLVKKTYLYSINLFEKNKDFRSWWNNYSKDNRNLPIELKQMVDYYTNSKSFDSSSQYWNYLNMRNIKQLMEGGYSNFKQTVARNYHVWMERPDSPHVKTLLSRINHSSLVLPPEETGKKHSHLTQEESLRYNSNTILLLSYLKKIGGDLCLDLLEEPLEGNPPFLTYEGKRITQDVLNSILEYHSVAEGCDLNQVRSILEIGAGSGRTAFCFMKLLPHIKYVVVDIPPALFVAQTYLSNTFKDKKIFRFRPFESFEEIKDEFERSDILLLMPDQLDLLPSKSIDLILGIDCFHEMTPQQIEYYFKNTNRLAKHFYFKVWRKSVIPIDNISYTSTDYPVSPEWEEIYNRQCDVPSGYFEAFYKMDGSSPTT